MSVRDSSFRDLSGLRVICSVPELLEELRQDGYGTGLHTASRPLRDEFDLAIRADSCIFASPRAAAACEMRRSGTIAYLFSLSSPSCQPTTRSSLFFLSLFFFLLLT
jgi:hypothetical protein